jgi:hypothetical protein
MWGIIGEKVWLENSLNVPKRWHFNYRRRGLTQKKAYDIQKTRQNFEIKKNQFCLSFLPSFVISSFLDSLPFLFIYSRKWP